jgi:hypothetical protein
LLAYFQSRRHVRYFPVIDEVATAAERPDGILYNRFEFNGEAHQLGADFDWHDNPSPDPDWLRQLHRFGFAVGLGRAFQQNGDLRYRDKWVELTRSWIAKAPPADGPAEVAACRLQNWIFAYRHFVAAKNPPGMDAAFHAELLASIHRQAAQLGARPAAGGQECMAVLHALFLTGVVFPEFTESAGWRRFAVEELLILLRSRMGGGCCPVSERMRSELAQALAMRRLALLNRIEMPAELDACMRERLDLALQLLRPDGRVPALGGACGDWLDLLRQACELYDDPLLLYVATRGKQGSAPLYRPELPESYGYAVLRSGWGGHGRNYAQECYLLLDCGPVQQDSGRFNPLGIEVAGYGHGLIVDPDEGGMAESEPAGWRRRRNGIVVDCRESAGAEPSAAGALVQSLRATVHRPGLDYLHGVATSPECPVIHERKILFIAGEYWLICDLLRADDLHDYELLFHLHPAALNRVVAGSDSTGLQVDAPNLVMAQSSAGDIELAIETAPVWLAQGGRQPAPVVKFSRRGARCCFYTVVYPYRSARPGLVLERLPVEGLGEQIPADIAAGLSVLHRTQRGLFRDELYLSHLSRSHFRFAGESTDSPFLVRRINPQGEILFHHEAGDAR